MNILYIHSIESKLPTAQDFNNQNTSQEPSKLSRDRRCLSLLCTPCGYILIAFFEGGVRETEPDQKTNAVEQVQRRDPEVIDQEESTQEVTDDDEKHVDESIEITMAVEYFPLSQRELLAVGVESAQPIVGLYFEYFQERQTQTDGRDVGEEHITEYVVPPAFSEMR